MLDVIYGRFIKGQIFGNITCLHNLCSRQLHTVFLNLKVSKTKKIANETIQRKKKFKKGNISCNVI